MAPSLSIVIPAFNEEADPSRAMRMKSWPSHQGAQRLTMPQRIPLSTACRRL
jgi:hypothetical protein